MNHTIDLEAFVRTTGDAIIAVNLDGIIVSWNPAAEHIFGYFAAEALGQSLNLIIPERFRQRHWRGFRHTMQTGTSKYGTQTMRVPALHRDGQTLSVAFTLALLPSSDTTVETIVATVRDETERWNEERELRNRVAELEGRAAQYK